MKSWIKGGSYGIIGIILYSLLSFYLLVQFDGGRLHQIGRWFVSLYFYPAFLFGWWILIILPIIGFIMGAIISMIFSKIKSKK